MVVNETGAPPLLFSKFTLRFWPLELCALPEAVPGINHRPAFISQGFPAYSSNMLRCLAGVFLLIWMASGWIYFNSSAADVVFLSK